MWYRTKSLGYTFHQEHYQHSGWCYRPGGMAPRSTAQRLQSFRYRRPDRPWPFWACYGLHGQVRLIRLRFLFTNASCPEFLMRLKHLLPVWAGSRCVSGEPYIPINQHGYLRSSRTGLTELIGEWTAFMLQKVSKHSLFRHASPLATTFSGPRSVRNNS